MKFAIEKSFNYPSDDYVTLVNNNNTYRRLGILELDRWGWSWQSTRQE